MNPDHTEIAEVYRQRREEFDDLYQAAKKRDRVLTHWRTLVFLLSATLLALGWFSGHEWIWYTLGGVGMAGFFALVTYHEYLVRELERDRILRDINDQAIHRMNRDWAKLSEAAIDVPAKHRAISNDLDLFGHASVFHYLCTANTPSGKRVLRDWLLEPATPAEIQGRQQAAQELASRVELREALNLEGSLLSDRSSATERFVQWAESEPWLPSRPWLVWTCRVITVAVPLSVLLTCLGILTLQIVAFTLLGIFLLNLSISVLFLSNVHDIFAQLSTRSGKVRGYLAMFELMYSMPDSSSELDRIKQDATRQGGGVLLRLRELGWIAGLAGISHSALMFIFVYLPLQFLLLYDFHVLNLLEIWQQKYGQHARAWFLSLGRFEALSSLANVVYDNPDWSFPDVSQSNEQLRAEGLGHPLLPSDIRVANDVELGPTGTFLLVTGSNMSGKSTLLRSIGVNAVLAEAGAPVCAASMKMPPVVLATSMRVHDSLEFGVSFYMAELMRLKEVVDLARSVERQEDRTVLYLLDEILQGTNSKERHIAVERVLKHLLQHGAIGAVSTHDLELATSPGLRDVCQCVHFRETLHGQQEAQPMTFDYRLRSGIATTTNALKLLELVGLGDEPEAQSGY